MPLFALDKELVFPPVHLAEPDGLLAMGGDLSPERLLLAYQHGIFPWYEGDVPLWWSPDPRFVLFPQHLKISKSMQQLLKKNTFEFTINRAFEAVVTACKKSPRKGQEGTWITDTVRDAYLQMHQLGYAHSAEAWLEGKLVGGLYGLRIGQVYFGESMFSHVSNASKYAFIKYIQQLTSEELKLIDCQVYTSHLESLGAGMISRNAFIQLLEQYVSY
jgi:leucyl/phenylalanyl-tRNA---protein transferase